MTVKCTKFAKHLSSSATKSNAIFVAWLLTARETECLKLAKCVQYNIKLGYCIEIIMRLSNRLINLGGKVKTPRVILTRLEI